MRIDEYFSEAISKYEQESRPRTRLPVTPKLAAQFAAMRKMHQPKTPFRLHVYDVEALKLKG